MDVNRHGADFKSWPAPPAAITCLIEQLDEISYVWLVRRKAVALHWLEPQTSRQRLVSSDKIRRPQCQI